MSTKAVEARVGAFILAAIALVVGFVLLLGDFSLSRQQPLYVDFAYSGALQVGAPVRISGIGVGKVTSLGLLHSDVQPAPAAPVDALGRQGAAVVRAKLSLHESAWPLLRHDSVLAVGMQGVIGESYVEITGGLGAPLAAASAIRGVDAPRLDVMLLHFARVLETVGNVLGDGSFDGDKSGEPPSELGTAAANILRTINRLLVAREDELGAALTDASATLGDLRAVVGAVKAAFVDGQQLQRMGQDATALSRDLRQNVPDLLKEMRLSLAALQGLLQRADGVVDAAVLNKIIGDVDRAVSDLAALSRDARGMVSSVNRGEGTVGGLVKDPQIYDDIKELMRDLKRNPWKILWRD